MRSGSSTLLWAVLVVVLLAGSYEGLKISMGGHHTDPVRTRTFRLSISSTLPVEEPPVFKAVQGDSVTLIVDSDRPGEVHVHGYERKIVLKSDGEVTLTFTAKDAGLFPLHLHDPDGAMHGLATLEVQPK